MVDTDRSWFEKHFSFLVWAIPIIILVVTIGVSIAIGTISDAVIASVLFSTLGIPLLFAVIRKQREIARELQDVGIGTSTLGDAIISLQDRFKASDKQNRLLARASGSFGQIIAGRPEENLPLELQNMLRNQFEKEFGRFGEFLGAYAEQELAVSAEYANPFDKALFSHAQSRIRASSILTDRVIDFWRSERGKAYWAAHLEAVEAMGGDGISSERVFVVVDHEDANVDRLTPDMPPSREKLLSFLHWAAEQHIHARHRSWVISTTDLDFHSVQPADVLIINDDIVSLTEQARDGTTMKVTAYWGEHMKLGECNNRWNDMQECATDINSYLNGMQRRSHTKTEKFVEFFVSTAHSAFSKWYVEQPLREIVERTVNKSLANEVDLSGFLNVAAAHRSGLSKQRYVCVLPGNALACIRFGKNPDRQQFAYALVEHRTFELDSIDRLVELRGAIQRDLKDLEVDRICLYMNSPEQERIGRDVLNELISYKRFPAGILTKLKERPRPSRSHEIELILPDTIDFYDQYKTDYEDFWAENDDLSKLVRIESKGDMERYLKSGVIRIVEIEGQWAGIVAAARGEEFGMCGWCMHERIMPRQFRGQRLSHPVLWEFLQEIPNKREDLVWGTIVVENVRSLQSAKRAGRIEVGGTWWLPLKQ